MCLHEEWFCLKNLQVQLLTVPKWWFCPCVMVTQYVWLCGAVNEWTLYFYFNGSSVSGVCIDSVGSAYLVGVGRPDVDA